MFIPSLSSFAARFQSRRQNDVLKNMSSATHAVYSVTSLTVPRSKPVKGLLALPQELIDAICAWIPLRSQLNLGATCRPMGTKVAHDKDSFWRNHILRLHGDCFWELRDEQLFPKQGPWRRLLACLTSLRRDVLACAGMNVFRQFEKERVEEMITELAEKDLGSTGDQDAKVPVGLKNRLRIWLVLEGVGMDGRQLEVAGQVIGRESSG